MLTNAFASKKSWLPRCLRADTTPPRRYAQHRSPSRLNALRPCLTAILFLHVDSSSCRSRHSQRAPFAMEGGFKLALTINRLRSRRSTKNSAVQSKKPPAFLLGAFLITA
jgi:hypothetical protein